MEKHWRTGGISHTAVDLFWDAVTRSRTREDVPVIIPTAKSYLFSILRGGLFFMAPVPGEAPALSVLEFLHRTVDTLELYFGSVSAESLTRNFSTVYQLLEEMIDSGYPLITEPNQLMTLIPPPSLTGRMAALVTGRAKGVGDTLDKQATSVIPWRRGGVSYMQNEIFFDIMEEIDCIIDPNGVVVRNDVRGRINCNCRLSGMPDLSLHLNDTSVIEDVSLHPCVRLARFQRDRVVSFVPPDGPFKLLEYRSADRAHSSPVVCRPEVTWRDVTGTATFTLAQKSLTGVALAGGVTRGSTGGVGVGAVGAAAGGGGPGGVAPEGPQVEGVVLVITFPSAVKSVDCVTETGRFTFDADTNAVTWVIGKLPPRLPVSIRAEMALAEGATAAPIEPVSAILNFVLPGATVSGLNVKDLLLVNSDMKFFKGARSVLQTGRFQIRA